MPHASSERLGLEAVPFPYKMTTICFLGPSAYVPIHSALTLFRDEFEARIKPRRAHPRRGGRLMSTDTPKPGESAAPAEAAEAATTEPAADEAVDADAVEPEPEPDPTPWPSPSTGGRSRPARASW